MGPSPNAVLSDVHQIASGVDTTVAVLGVLSNRKSRVCIPGRRHRRPLTCPAALKDSTLPASVCVGRGSAIGTLLPKPDAASYGRRCPRSRPLDGRQDSLEAAIR